MSTARRAGTALRTADGRGITAASTARGVADGVRALPGVTRVFTASSGLGRWFGEPLLEFGAEAGRARALVTIGADRHSPAGWTRGLVVAYLRARFVELGFDDADIRVRIVLLS